MVKDIKYNQQKKGIEWILKYFYEHNVGDMFKKGTIRYGVDFDVIRVSYAIENQESFIALPIDTNCKSLPDDLKDLLQDFMLNTYINHEWDGQKMRPIDIARLLGVHPNRITNVIQTIQDEIKYKYEHLLQ